MFKLSSKDQLTVLYAHFFAGGKGGAYLDRGVIFDAKGNLYGTTFGGGTAEDGTVFKLTP